MKITFIGAARCVTGSCILLEHEGLRILIDCGLPQGSDEKRSARELPFESDSIDYVLLTHAHIDHSGRLPLLAREEGTDRAFKGKIICTKASAELCGIMLPDSAYIQQADAEWQTRKNLRSGKEAVQPLYDTIDAENILKYFCPKDYGEDVKLSDRITARFTDAGHMLGSSSITLEYMEKKQHRTIVFSGDIGNLNQPIIKDPEYLHKADYVVMESTYGDRIHTHNAKSTQELAQTLQALIEETFSRGGRVIIPAFSVGRSQEILYLIRYIVNKTGRPIPTYLDSPLSVKATATFLRNVVGYYDSEAMAVIESGQNPILFNGFCAITDVEDSKLLNTSNESCVIISSSGMCEAGRIRHHLKHNLYKPNNTIVFTGYQAGGTLGERILSGADTVSILGEQIAVKAKITKLEGISGHADKDGLLQWIDKFSPKPKHVFVVHGDAKTSRYFAGLLKESRAINARAPEPDTSVLLK